MPYNPGSAYPRKTIYVPPTHGKTSFRPAVNASDYASQNTMGGVPFRPRGREAYASEAASARGASNHPDAAAGFEARSRPGMFGALANRYNEEKGLRQNKKKAAGEKSPAQRGEVDRPAPPSAGARLPGGYEMDQTNKLWLPGETRSRPPSTRGTPSHGNTAALNKRAAASELSDTMVDMVLNSKRKRK